MKNIAIVAVIGKYFSPNNFGAIEKNIFLARQLSRMVWMISGGRMGAITPHMNTAHFEVLTNVGEPMFREAYCEILERACDAAIVVPKWQDSMGTIGEIELCNRLGKPVFHELDSLRVWRDAFFTGDPEPACLQHKDIVLAKGKKIQITYSTRCVSTALTEEEVLAFNPEIIR